MALVNCENCGSEVSDKAKVCPKCGKNIKRDFVPILTCPECGKEIETTETHCGNCGYKLKQGNEAKKKKISIIGFMAMLILLVICVVVVANKKGDNYVLDACEEIQKNLSNPNSLSLQEVYISDEMSTDTTIDYVYRVYVVYKYTNSYDSKKEGTALYVVDDNGKTYFIEDSSSEQLYAYKSIAEMEIFGLSGWFEPSDNWTELKSSEIEKIEKKIE